MHTPPSGRIAIVDDEASVRRALARLLRSAGHATEEFASGRDFLLALARQHYSCLILDLHMPQMPGMQVQMEQTVRDAGTAVIAITACDDQESRERCLAAGARAYLCKPFDEAELLSAIEGIFPGSGA